MSKKSEKINNDILADARKDIRNTQISIIIGIILIVTIITLVSIGIFNLGSLIFILILGYLVYTQIDSLRMKQAVFTLQRYIFEDGFKEKYDKEHNINQK